MKLAHTAWGDFEYWDNDGIGNCVANGYFWDEHFRAVFDEVTPGSVVVDVGANLGWFTVYAAKRGCHVFAFEACPEVFDLLRANVERNGVGIHVSMFPLALYERCEQLRTIPLNADDPANQVFVEGRIDTGQCKNSGSFVLRPGAGSAYDMYAVPLDYFHLRGVSLIKVDTEGCDLAVLKGAAETIRTNRPVLCYEYNQGVLAPPLGAYEKLMERYGYGAVQVHEANEGTYKDFIARPK